MVRRIEWSGYEWMTSERWGQVHPSKDFCFYDESAVTIDDDRNLVLKTHKNPTEFYVDGEKKIVPIGIGLVSCTSKFKHGYFEIEAKQPTGKHLWSAFWMWAWESHPPEIDVFEGYTGKRQGYFKLLPKPWAFWNIQTNVHYGKSGFGKMVRGKTHFFGFKNPRKHFIKYGCLWTPDRIEFYYNGRKVRTIKDPEVMKSFEGTTMNVIINNHVDYEVDRENPPISSMIVKSFKYIPWHLSNNYNSQK